MNKGKLIALISSISAVVVGAVVATIIIVTSSKKTNTESYRTIKIFDYTGEVIVTRSDKEITVNAKGMNLKSGDELSTKDESTVALKLDEDKYIYIKENTTIKLYATGTSKNTKTSFHLEKGSIVGEIQNRLEETESFDVYSANSVMSIHGTAFSCSALEKDGESVVTYALYRGNATTSVYEKAANGTYKANTINQVIGQKYEITVAKEKTLKETELKTIVDKVNEKDLSGIEITDNNTVEDANMNMENTSINGAKLTNEEKKDIVDVIDDIKKKSDAGEESSTNKDLIIYSFYGEYDGFSHSITLENTTGYEIRYSLDNETFVNENYSFTDTGFYIIYVKATDSTSGGEKFTGYGTVEIVGKEIVEKEDERTVDASSCVKVSDLELPVYEGFDVKWTYPEQELELGLNYVDYTVSAMGYDSLRGTSLITCELAFTYTIKNGSSVYDGKIHSVTVESNNTDINIFYSLDGTRYISSCPEFTDAGTYNVFIKIESGKRVIIEEITLIISKATIDVPDTYAITVEYKDGIKLKDVILPTYEGFDVSWVNPDMTLVSGRNEAHYIIKSNNHEPLTCDAVITAIEAKANISMYVEKTGLWNDSYVLIDNERIDNYCVYPVNKESVTLKAFSAPGYAFNMFVILNEYGEEISTIEENNYSLEVSDEDIYIKACFKNASSISTSAFTIKTINEALEEVWMGQVLDNEYSYCGGTIYPYTGGSMTLLAVSDNESRFIGWYKLNGEELTEENLVLISTDEAQTFTINEETTVYAMFASREMNPFAVAVSSDGYFTVEGDEHHYNYKEFNNPVKIQIHLNDGIDFNGNAWVENGINRQYLSSFEAEVFGTTVFSLLNPTYTINDSFNEECAFERTCNSNGIIKLSKESIFEYKAISKYDEHKYEVISRIGNCFTGWKVIEECVYCGNEYYHHESARHTNSAPSLTKISDDFTIYTYTCSECGFMEHYRVHNEPVHKEFIEEGTTITLQHRYETSNYTWSRYYWNETITKVGGIYYIEVLKKDGASGSVEQQYLYVIEPYNNGYRVYKREDSSVWGLAEYEYEDDIIDIFNTHVYSKLYKGLEFFNSENIESYFDRIEYLPNEILTISNKDYNCEVIRISSRKFYFYDGVIIQMCPDVNASDYYASSNNESIRIQTISNSTEISSSFDGYSNGNSSIYIQIRSENASPRVYLNGRLTYPKSGYGWYYIEDGQTLTISGYVGEDGYTGFHFERFDVSTKKWVPFYPENDTFEVSSSDGFRQYKIVGDHPDTVSISSEIIDFFYDEEHTMPVTNSSEIVFGTTIYASLKEEYRNTESDTIMSTDDNDSHSYYYDFDFSFTAKVDCVFEFYRSDYQESNYISIEWSNYGEGYMIVGEDETNYLYIDDLPEIETVTLNVKNIAEGYQFDGWYVLSYDGDNRNEVLYSKDIELIINLNDIHGNFSISPKFVFENGAIHTIKALNDNILLAPENKEYRSEDHSCYYTEIGFNTVTTFELYIEDGTDEMQIIVTRNGRTETMSYYYGVKIYDVESDTTVEISS